MKIVIIGAGVAGLSIGWRLAQAGAEVVVLDRAQPGQGATWASAGMISVEPEDGDETAPLAQFARYSGGLWPDFAAEIEAQSGRRIGYRRDGALVVAPDAAHAERLSQRAAGGRERGGKFLTPDEARTLEPLLGANVAGALFEPQEAQVDNRALGPALASAFVRAGGDLRINEAVVRLELTGSRATAALTPFATYSADAFLLAAGAWTARIEGLPAGAVPPVVPVKGEMIALSTPEPGLLPSRQIWSNEVYLVPRHGRLLVGATATWDGWDTSLTDRAANWLKSHASAAMPTLAYWEIAEHWAGLRPGSPDDLPILGETRIEGLYVASGQFRNGILLAPAIAEVLRGLILERRMPQIIAAFNPRRFEEGGLLAEAGRLR